MKSDAASRHFMTVLWPLRVLDRLRRHNERSNGAYQPGLRTVPADVRVSAHGDGLVMLHIPSGRVFVCNSTGARIWKAILDGSNAESISEQISGEFDVPPRLAQEHARAFVEKLEQQGLLMRA